MNMAIHHCSHFHVILQTITEHGLQQITRKAGGCGSGPTCVNNCTIVTPPPVDCTKNPIGPSCTQALTPSTTAPTTKTCPDGSVIDASAICPTQPN